MYIDFITKISVRNYTFTVYKRYYPLEMYNPHSPPPFGVSDAVTPIDSINITLETVFQKVSNINISKFPVPDGWPPAVQWL